MPTPSHPHPKLHAYIAHQGYCSRRQAEELIAQGKVTVNGKKAIIGQRVDPQIDHIFIQGKPLNQTSATNLEYYLIYKPASVVATTSDELHRRTVLDLVPETSTRLYPVGRLDKNSEGLMLLTNDGALTQQLTHPSFETHKTYAVQVDRQLTTKAIEHLEKGVKLKEGYTQPAEVEIVEIKDLLNQYPILKADMNDGTEWLNVTIHEGRNHQVRRMLERVGYPVLRLIRLEMGPFSLKQLGKQRYKKVSLPF